MAVDTLARAIAAGKVPVTAYEMAVKAGYTGTEAQFAEDMGNSGTNATNAANSATAAAASATTAANAAGNLAPAYSASATYAVGDHVLYDGGYYVCNTAITTAEAWTAAHWTAAKVGPEITDLKTHLGNSADDLLAGIEPNRAKFWENINGVATESSATGYYTFDPIEVVVGGTYEAKIYRGSSNKHYPIYITDESLNIIDSYIGEKTSYNEFTITVDNPQAKYALITTYTYISQPDYYFKYIHLNSVPDIIEDVSTLNNDVSKVKKTDITKNKYLSIIGDSISALQGTIPEGNLAYYTGNNYGIQTSEDMWWGIVANTLGMTVLVNNSWSGSRVCDPNYAEGDAIPASYPARCQAIDDGTHNPDYVIIAMGVNDYSYNSLMGDWDGKTMPVDDVDFMQSYALMINRINSKYPNAKLFCLSPWFVQRGQDKGINYANSQAAHLTESKYGDAIRKLCEMLGAIYIDSYVGFNRYNYYPTYCEDSAETPTHPNKAGQAVMGKVITEKIRTLIF